MNNNNETFITAPDCKETLLKIQAAVLLHSLEQEARDILPTIELTISKTDKQDPKKINEALDNYFIPETNTR